MATAAVHPPPADDCKEGRNSIEDIWGDRTPYYEDWPVREDYRQVAEPDKWYQSACVLCSNGCGMDVGVKDNQIVAVKGRAVDRVNKGRLGPKGLHASIGLNQHKDRLLYPQIRKNGKLERCSWEEAMSCIVKHTKLVQEKYSSQAVAFYTSGQLMLEEYYTLALIVKAGIRTNHCDGNTRLCTATAAAAMRESFGSDGQTGSYTDIDVTDCIFMVGHNMSATQTVLWARILDRLAGKQPPKLVVIDPRRTACAKAATVHLAPTTGTNVAVLNGILRCLIVNNMVDKQYIDAHVYGYDELVRVTEKYTPELVAEISGVDKEQLVEAAKLIGSCERLMSTALQGVYQSHQATGAACQINNINLIRGMIGKPGACVLQMNGQPTAQNNRETGCDGEYTGFRNHLNPDHVQNLADHWNVEPSQISHWTDPTHVNDILHYIETKSVRMLWISGTNPAVSLPDLARIRRLLASPDLFVICQDIFPTETTKYADIILPAAMWGEKDGCFTNVDRTVHITQKAVEPPGECRSDFDIFCDYAARMQFKDKQDKPLVKWTTPREAFDAWARSSKGLLCDYSGLSYDKLLGEKKSGIQWPCNDKHPNGCERLYEDGHFETDIDRCETYGHDLETGASIPKATYVAMKVNGRAILKTIHYTTPYESINDDYPLWYTTGRVPHHFHTRTKTGRSKHLEAATPEPYVQLHAADAAKYGDIKDGDYVKVSSRRGSIVIQARVGDIDKGNVFVPFHFGYFDKHNDLLRAANELTFQGWDSVSKQPTLKFGCVSVQKIEQSELKIHEKQGSPTSYLSIPQKQTAIGSVSAEEETHSYFDAYTSTLIRGLKELHQVLTQAADSFRENYGFMQGLTHLATYSQHCVDILDQYVKAHLPDDHALEGLIHHTHFALDVKRLSSVEFSGIAVLEISVHIQAFVALLSAQATALEKAANGAQRMELVADMLHVQEQLNRMSAWTTTQIQAKAAQALVVAKKAR